ncbi:diguanylate cyclase domain-containing protein [Acaryochloris marina NIES-2412]|uniref:diguanylate cyclase domain-containing protein n=1 Tax=Acaryochloris marina TaxID=155978 RepID=UPI004057E127
MQLFQAKTSKFLKGLYQLLYKRVIIILVTLLGLGLSIAVVGTYYLSINLVDSQAMHYSKVAIKTLNETGRYYSSNVVDRLKLINDVEAIPEYHSISGGIPNPATFTIEIGDRLSNQSEGVIFRLYSDYPFPNRQATGGPQDQFEHAALNYLKKHPEASFHRKERVGNTLSFRYTEAVRMEASCVACHNTLPSSPKKDWKVGQVRGIVEITQPLDHSMLIAQDGLKTIYIVLATIIFLAISGLVLVIGRFRSTTQELEEKVAKRTAALNRLATTDGLTQLVNRRQFDQCLEQEWQRSQRQQAPFSLILCDVDCFKNYNDTYGHQLGDNCLRHVAQVLQNSVRRSGEIAARYGGEEFAIILPNVNSVEATQVASAIRNAIHQLQIPHSTSIAQTYVTLSMGIATMIPSLNNSPQELIKASDNALYQAKAQGRDRYISWNEMPS